MATQTTMRRIYTLLFAVSILMTAFAQMSQYTSQMTPSAASHVRADAKISPIEARMNFLPKSPEVLANHPTGRVEFDGWVLDVDSVVTDTYKFIMEYDEARKLSKLTSWNKDTSGKWIPVQMTEFQSSADHSYSTTYYEWSADKMDWVMTSKNEDKFDSRGNQLMHCYQQWTKDTESLTFYLKDEYEYDDRDNITKHAQKEWASYENKWRNFSTCYTYNDKNQLIEEIYLDGSKREYTYNNRGLIEFITYYYYNKCYDRYYKKLTTYTYDNEESGHCWAVENVYYSDKCIPGIYKYEYEFDEQGRTLMKAEYLQYEEDYSSITPIKYEYTYDEYGNVDFMLFYSWSRELNDWVYSYKIEYQFDQYGNQLMYASYDWSTETNSWVGTFNKSITSYKESGYASTGEFYQWDTDLDDWTLMGDFRYLCNFVYLTKNYETIDGEPVLKTFSVFDVDDSGKTGQLTTYYTEQFGGEKVQTQNLYFTVIGSNYISEVSVSENPFRIEGKSIVSDEPLDIHVYDITGLLLYSGNTDCVTMPKAGIYMIETEGHVYKVVLK